MTFVLNGKDDGDEQLLVSALDADCLDFVIRHADASVAVDALLSASRRAVRRARLRLLLLPVDRDHPVNASDVFGLPDIKLVPDILVARTVDEGNRLTVLPSNEAQSAISSCITSFKLVTVKFTGQATWRDELVVARWYSGSGLDQPLAEPFPCRLTNLEGRQLIFATLHYPPYVVLEGAPGILDGTETRILSEFINKVNASWQVTEYAEEKWGAIWDNNGSGNGILGAVVNGEADVAYAAVYQWFHEYLYLDYTRPYVRTGITCLAPRPLVQSGWQVPLLPFSANMWAAVASSVLLATLALFATKMATTWVLGSVGGSADGRYSSVEDCFFRSVGLLVLQAPDVERRHTRVVGPTRHVLSWLLIAYLLVTASYGSGLSSVLTVPRYDPPIDTVSDLHSSGLDWAETHIAWLNSLRERTEDIFRDLCRRFRVMKEGDLHARTTTRDLAFPMERLPSGYFAIGEYIDEEAASKWLRPMREDIYWEWVVIAVPKRWPHLEQLDGLIDRLIESGLLLAWEGQVSRQWMAPRVQLAVQAGARASSPAGDDPVQLRLSHVQGEFALLTLGLCLSLIAFVAEMVANKYSSTVVERESPSAAAKALQRPEERRWREHRTPLTAKHRRGQTAIKHFVIDLALQENAILW
ncbi:glutamate receptor ionotropic, kainate glr-3-like [Schistocerca gregaria]|uniref:glutamate receptor ionotropic, kainate glr-3-like n=1 Tax=Schistocerca gregaria TaxID=7010 RepID=UPI00211E7780|nr:glutamate receptor ionotropic, kainate glr-3-like [Schistocerca gregaria]